MTIRFCLQNGQENLSDVADLRKSRRLGDHLRTDNDGERLLYYATSLQQRDEALALLERLHRISLAQEASPMGSAGKR
jgi:hypothetical protein